MVWSVQFCLAVDENVGKLSNVWLIYREMAPLLSFVCKVLTTLSWFFFQAQANTQKLPGSVIPTFLGLIPGSLAWMDSVFALT